MRIVVIGGTGHIGSYLTPMLVEEGFAVTCVCRGASRPYCEHPTWLELDYCRVDRIAEEAAGTFGKRIAAIGAEAVIDLTCYHVHSARQLVEALEGNVNHFLHCGTIWVHGSSVSVPTVESEPRRPFGDYGVRKAAIEAWLLERAERTDLPVTVLHPGHLVGPGWHPINPVGNFNPEVFTALAHGTELRVPNFGMETLQHVHAEDVARAFVLALRHRQESIRQSFHVVAASALTLRGYAEQVALWFQQPARLRFLPWEEWKASVSERDARVTEDHLRHSPHCSIEKARAKLGYEPRYSPLSAIKEAVNWMIETGIVAGPSMAT
jgi:nucleoside-diphosphate-sugar epimerase